VRFKREPCSDEAALDEGGPARGGRRSESKLLIKSLFDRTTLPSPCSCCHLCWRRSRSQSRPGTAHRCFKQVRVGRNSEPFKLWRFRAMVVNADQLKARLTGQDEGNGALFKIFKDPQSTKSEPGCAVTP